MPNRLDTILACDGRTDRQTDGQTSCHGIVRAMHTRRAVKIGFLRQALGTPIFKPWKRSKI